MNRYLSVFTLLLSFQFAGCSERAGSGTDILDSGIKAGQLRPVQQFERRDLINVGLIVYVFEIDQQRWDSLRGKFSDFNKLKAEYTSFGAFSADGLMLASGDRTAWQLLSDYITKAKTMVVTQVNTQILQGMKGDIVISSLKKPATVYYVSNDNITSGIGLNAGDIVLRLEPDSLIGLRQASKITVSLLHSSNAENGRSGAEFVFSWANFSVNMTPGQFFILAPRQIRQTPPMLADTFLTTKQPRPMVRFILVMCNSVIE